MLYIHVFSIYLMVHIRAHTHTLCGSVHASVFVMNWTIMTPATGLGGPTPSPMSPAMDCRALPAPGIALIGSHWAVVPTKYKGLDTR